MFTRPPNSVLTLSTEIISLTPLANSKTSKNWVFSLFSWTNRRSQLKLINHKLGWMILLDLPWTSLWQVQHNLTLLIIVKLRTGHVNIVKNPNHRGFYWLKTQALWINKLFRLRSSKKRWNKHWDLEVTQLVLLISQLTLTCKILGGMYSIRTLRHNLKRTRLDVDQAILCIIFYTEITKDRLRKTEIGNQNVI